MNLTRLTFLALACATSFALTACSSVDLNKDKGATEVTITDEEALQKMLNDPNSPLYKKEVFFAFNSYAVDSQNMEVVTNHAKFLAANRNINVRLEGNTDERGGREYNLALGQKRAEAVKQRMTVMGVSPDQLETISFGKERPKAYGHTEADWAENRRVDINYMLKKSN